MCSNIAISTKNLNKIYRIYDKPRDRILQIFMPGRRKQCAEYKALRNISFDVKRGETVGIIGRNGSGKSTLLQIICGTLLPSNGQIEVNGRIAALLELGAGFNSDFTGRENVFFNASILGLSRKETEKRFDTIAKFADIGSYIDQPVRTYSSGMYMRLAFAVAINVEPDILIIDEALSVGDEAFQRKCFSRLEEIKNNGATILFVSHTASLILQFCDRAILLDSGELLFDGLPRTAITQYHKLIYAPESSAEKIREQIRAGHIDSENNQNPAREIRGNVVTANRQISYLNQPREEDGDYDPNLVSQSKLIYEKQGASIEEFYIENQNGRQVNVLHRGGDYTIFLRILFYKDACSVRCGSMLKTITGQEIGGLMSHPLGDGVDFIQAGKQMTLRLRFKCVLLGGTYFLSAGVASVDNGEQIFMHRITDGVIFRVLPEHNLTLAGIVDIASPLQSDYEIGEPKIRESN